MGNIRSVFSKLGLDVRIVPASDDYLILLNSPAASSELEQLARHVPKLISSLSLEYPDLHLCAGCGRPHPGIRGSSKVTRRPVLPAYRNDQ